MKSKKIKTTVITLSVLLFGCSSIAMKQENWWWEVSGTFVVMLLNLILVCAIILQE